jgi:hypothetical protein
VPSINIDWVNIWARGENNGAPHIFELMRDHLRLPEDMNLFDVRNRGSELFHTTEIRSGVLRIKGHLDGAFAYVPDADNFLPMTVMAVELKTSNTLGSKFETAQRQSVAQLILCSLVSKYNVEQCLTSGDIWYFYSLAATTNGPEIRYTKATNWDEGIRHLQSRLDTLGRVDNHRILWNRDSGYRGEGDEGDEEGGEDEGGYGGKGEGESDREGEGEAGRGAARQTKGRKGKGEVKGQSKRNKGIGKKRGMESLLLNMDDRFNEVEDMSAEERVQYLQGLYRQIVHNTPILSGTYL